MSLILTTLAIPIAFFGLTKINENGEFTNKMQKLVIGNAFLILGLILWMITMGSLRGVFAYLGLLTVLGLVLSFAHGYRRNTNAFKSK